MNPLINSNAIYSIIILIAVLFNNTIEVNAQEYALRITNSAKEKEVLIKEGKRIRIKLITGEKLSGRFKIINGDSIEIRRQKIAFSSIKKIKKNPLLVQIVTTAGLVYTIAFPATLLIYFSSSGAETALVTLVGTTAGISFLEPNFLKGHYLKECRIEVISLE